MDRGVESWRKKNSCTKKEKKERALRAIEGKKREGGKKYMEKAFDETAARIGFSRAIESKGSDT